MILPPGNKLSYTLARNCITNLLYGKGFNRSFIVCAKLHVLSFYLLIYSAKKESTHFLKLNISFKYCFITNIIISNVHEIVGAPIDLGLIMPFGEGLDLVNLHVRLVRHGSISDGSI